MALEINLKQKPVGIFESKLGKLYIFPLSLGAQRNLHKLLGESFSETNPEIFVKHLITEVCYLENDLLEGKYRPDKPSSILKEDTAKLNSEELENFADTYIKNNEYLFKESKTKTKKNERGNSVLYQELGEVIYPRDEGENSVNYLHRLSIIEENKQREQFAKLTKPFGAITGFSNTLTESIKKSLLMGDSLKKRMEAIRPPSFADIRPVDSHFKQTDYSDIFVQQEKNRLKPFNNLAGKLDELIGSSAQVADFMVETNKIQAGIAKELKNSGDTAVRFSKINIAISCLVVFLTVCSLYMAYSVSKGSIEKELATRNATEKYVNGIVKEINGLSMSILDDKATKQQNTALFVKELKKISNSHILQLEKIITEQNQTLVEIKLTNEKNTEKIKELENQLKAATKKE